MFSDDPGVFYNALPYHPMVHIAINSVSDVTKSKSIKEETIRKYKYPKGSIW